MNALFLTATTALAPMLWGSTYLVTTQYLPENAPFTAALIRTLPAGLILLLWHIRDGWPPRFLQLVLLGALNIGVFQALLFVAAYRLPGGLAAIVGALQPLIILGLNSLTLRRLPPRHLLFLAALALIGMTLMIGMTEGLPDPLGLAAAFAGTASMATGVWLTRRWQLPLSTGTLTGWQLTLGGLMLLPFAGWAEWPMPWPTPSAWAGYAYLTFGGALVAYLLWFRGVHRLPSVAVVALGLLSPITATALGWGVLGQALSPSALSGMVLTLFCVVLLQTPGLIGRRRRIKQHMTRTPGH
ncbi:EamA family transporter [Larsenimonas salina]|uniref:EamA family transporter n=1 Tax=Larsenimonas salina TaxID=1295565 RepID=UPI002072A56A|nr:EamA family transporter [Larsenimonas salina]MCM5704602.1 EamA family transporter [Larsenimonas salina]